jgi:4-cresol dehydrogenase (hydroxylating)
VTSPDDRALSRFLADVERRSSDLEILTGDDCVRRYSDPFRLRSLGDGTVAAVRPSGGTAIQDIVRSANEHGVPLWPISRGENLGYGGSASFGDAAVILDLSRMNRILAVNVEDAFCLVEPGVSFVDMHDHLQRHDLPLWLSVPGYGLGSMVGNALERGVGNSPYGDHASQICGLEVVLGDGELVRTGMGALSGSGMWQRQRAALGPRYDELFVQSGYGVVTKMGLWLMPQPEASAAIEIELSDRDGLGGLVETLTSLKRQAYIQDSPVIASFLTMAALRSVRSDWSDERRALNLEESRRLRDALGLGWWNARTRLYGPVDMVELCLGHVEKALRPFADSGVRVSRWRRGEPIENAHRGIPSGGGLANAQWCGEGGAHVDLAVALPLSGAEAMRHALRVMDLLESVGVDYHSAFYLRERHMLNIVQLLFDRNDTAMCEAVEAAYKMLIIDASMRGYGVTRAPAHFRADAMAVFDFADHALSRMGARIKAALDPGAILSPGKDGFPAEIRPIGSLPTAR